MSLINKNFKNNIYRFSHQAMNTIFEIVIDNEEKVYAEQAANAAFEEIDRLEEELSRFLPNSEVARINSLAIGEKLRLSSDVFECLNIAKHIYNITKGIFDITAGHIIDFWKTTEGSNNNKLKESVFNNFGMDKIILDETNYLLTALTNDINIDLGGIGKGFAIDKALELLTEWDITNALIHSGSTVKAKGILTGNEGWPVSISNPSNSTQTIAEIILTDNSISGSGNQKGTHIINPKTSLPIKDNAGAWAVTESAAISDAMSTAFMIMPIEDISNFCNIHSEISCIVIKKEIFNIIKNDIFISNKLKFVNFII